MYGKLGTQSTIRSLVPVEQTTYSRVNQRHGAHQTRLFGKVDVVTGAEVSNVATRVATRVAVVVVSRTVFFGERSRRS